MLSISSVFKLSYVLGATVSLLFKKLFFILYCRLYKSFNTLLVIQVLNAMYYSLITIIIGSKKLEWKTHWQSPVCRDILRRKHFISHSKSSLLWALFYFSVGIILIFDINTKSILSIFLEYSDVIWYVELYTAIVVCFNACVASCFYAWTVFVKPMPISPIQQKLFGINETDPGFLVKNKDSSQTMKDNKLVFTTWHDSDQSLLSITPLNYSAKSWANSPSCLESSSSSWSYYRPSTIYMSTPKAKHKDSFISKKSLLFESADDSLLIRNTKQLNEFLKVCEEEEKKVKSMSYEDAVSSVSLDGSLVSILCKSRYQRACRLPSTETIESNSSETGYGDVLHKLKITEKMLTSWCEKFRKWISQTILLRLVAEIEDINSSLCHMSLPEYQIGTVNLFALHQIAVTKFQHLATLSAVLPYLDMHLNQEYLVQRLKSLAKGGCLSEFKWNSGGPWGDKAWCEDLPTDSAIILHVLCCYLDAYLPPEPHFPTGKSFSSRYFKKVPEKLSPSNEGCFIYQSSIIPPHFKVVIGPEIYSLQKGRSNLFYAFLIFFHHLRTKESSMLGRVNLGPSGLNLLWVID